MPTASPQGDEAILMNGFNTSPIVPSAPLYEANVNQQTAVKSISSEHPSEFTLNDSDSVTNEELELEKFQLLSPDNSILESAQLETKVKHVDEPVDELKSKGDDGDKKDKGEKNEIRPKAQNLYSEFDNLVTSSKTESQPVAVKTHSYENLDPDQMEPDFATKYDSLKHASAHGDDYDSSVQIQTLKEVDLTESPVQSEHKCWSSIRRVFFCCWI